ncbi:hypothetical protein [Vreelandella titanicae]|uniref:hypothetical protein n=1 Tax=Vreelandella titanicae TaxID=664683 RepID=UPI0039BF484D
MNYEAWRISFQDSEQAAKAAFEESQRWERLFAMAIGSVVELTEAAGIRKEDQLMGGATQALNAIEKLKERREKWKARALKAEKDRDDYHIAEQRQIALRQKVETERDGLEQDAASLLRLVTKIRAAAGDPSGKLMQPELVAHIAALNDHRDAISHSAGLKKAALFIEQRAESYDAEHGNTDPSTGHREYPGDGAEYYNDLMELADELRRQADGGTQ